MLLQYLRITCIYQFFYFFFASDPIYSKHDKDKRIASLVTDSGELMSLDMSPVASSDSDQKCYSLNAKHIGLSLLVKQNQMSPAIRRGFKIWDRYIYFETAFRA